MSPKFQLSDAWLPCLILLVLWACPAAAFGAGNIAHISKLEGKNWRHGDIEDTLLTLLISGKTGKKFSKMDVKRVYFGNWLRDYSQAVDVGALKMVSSEAIRILLWVIGFLTFGYGTKEFEVTRDRLGCYRPEEHIDNPKDYADNLDARDYDPRLRAPVDERRELAINPDTLLKNYIASEGLGIATSAGLVRDLLHRCIDLGRRSGGRGAEFYEALRLLGTASHCLEDYSAHSNYTELALIEMGAHAVFPHVGQNVTFRVDAPDRLEGAPTRVYPIVTGTFGGVDFLHSVCGEISDKASQSEIEELEGAINDANRKQNKSAIKDLLSKLPPGIFGDKDEASKADELEQNAQAAQMGNLKINPKDPEEFTQQIGELVKQIYPIMEFHDEIMQSISAFIENIPVLPELIEQVQEQVTVFVFSLLAPYVLPIIDQVKTELQTGSSEVIASDREKQLIVFNDPDSSDPTHSMLSKDHFTNILNEPAGRIASEVLKWAVPQIVACWDDDADPELTVNRIIEGVLHHPANRGKSNDEIVKAGRAAMYGAVQKWWDSFDDHKKGVLVQKLSYKGVKDGENQEGKDTGHGCCKPLGMANDFSGLEGEKSGNSEFKQVSNQAGKFASEAVGAGAFGDILGNVVQRLGDSLLNDVVGGAEKKSEKNENYGDSGSYSQSYPESGHHEKEYRGDSERYGHAGYQQTQFPDGRRREEYSRHGQDERDGSYKHQQRVETSDYGDSRGYQRQEERRFESGSQWQSENRREGSNRQGEYYNEKNRDHGHKHGKKEDQDSGDDDDDMKRMKKERKQREKEEKRNRKHGSGGEGSDDNTYKRRSGEHHRKSKSPSRHSGDRSHVSGYGEESRYGGDSYNSRDTGSYNRQASSRYGAESTVSGGGGYSGGESSGYGRDSYGAESYGSRQEPSGYGGGNDLYESRREGDEYGERRQEYRSNRGYDDSESRGYGDSGSRGEEDYRQRY